jgi:hypothetical protein
MKKGISNEGGLSGSYVIKTWDANKVKCFADTLKNKPLSVSKVIKNKIVLGTGYGRNIIIRQLGNDTTYAIPIDSAAIGTGTNTPASSDTGLQTPVLSSIAVADRTVGTDNVVISFFITDAQLANGTYTEFGIFCNLRLFARSLITPVYTKATNENVTVDYTITLNAV